MVVDCESLTARVAVKGLSANKATSALVVSVSLVPVLRVAALSTAVGGSHSRHEGVEKSAYLSWV